MNENLFQKQVDKAVLELKLTEMTSYHDVLLLFFVFFIEKNVEKNDTFFRQKRETK